MSTEQPHPLTLARVERNLTQDDLAQAVGVSSRTIWAAEHGKPVGAYTRRRLCKYFKKTAQELGLVSEESQVRTKKKKDENSYLSEDRDVAQEVLHGLQYTPQSAGEQKGDAAFSPEPTAQDIVSAAQELETQDMNKSRRDFLQTLGVTSATLVVSPQALFNPPLWERISRALKKPTSLDETTLNYLEMSKEGCYRLIPDIAGVVSNDLRNYVLEHLAIATDLLEGFHSTAIHRRLCAIVGELAFIAGNISFDMRDHDTARAYYQAAAQAGQEAGNHDFCAVVLARLSFISTYNGQAQAALPLIQEARRLAAQNSSTVIVSWLAAVEAEIQANMQEYDACLRALEKAEFGIDRMQPQDDLYRTTFDQFLLAGYKGVCYEHLQKPKEAMTVLHEALTQLDTSPSYFYHGPVILTDLAGAYAQDKEVEEACKYASKALIMTIQTNSPTLLQRICDFRRKLDPWSEVQAVQSLDEDMKTLFAQNLYRGIL